VTTSKGRFVADEVANARSRKRGGNTQKEHVTTPEQWREALPGVLKRLKVTLAEMYADDLADAGEAP
jgi:hypothetical protein